MVNTTAVVGLLAAMLAEATTPSAVATPAAKGEPGRPNVEITLPEGRYHLAAGPMATVRVHGAAPVYLDPIHPAASAWLQVFENGAWHPLRPIRCYSVFPDQSYAIEPGVVEKVPIAAYESFIGAQPHRVRHLAPCAEAGEPRCVEGAYRLRLEWAREEWTRRKLPTERMFAYSRPFELVSVGKRWHRRGRG